jgi:N-methylhydantoinase A
MHRIGVDVGGTFTDFTLLDEARAPSASTRWSRPGTTRRRRSRTGCGRCSTCFGSTRGGGGLSRPRHHGRDEHRHRAPRRAHRPDHHQGLPRRAGARAGRRGPRSTTTASSKPPPLVPRDRRVEVTERIGPDGEVLTPLDEVSLVAAAIERLRRRRWTASRSASCTAYRKPEHERARAEWSRADARCLRQRVVRDPAGVPRIRAHVDDGRERLRRAPHGTLSRALQRPRARIGIPVEPYTVHSNGGLMSPDTVRAARCAPASRAPRRASSARWRSAGSRGSRTS